MTDTFALLLSKEVCRFVKGGAYMDTFASLLLMEVHVQILLLYFCRRSCVNLSKEVRARILLLRFC